VTTQRIHPDPSGHFLVTESGQPFFWLADTAWELFHRLNRAQAEHYLEIRRQQCFNVIQAVILAEMDGIHIPDANGHLPLLGGDRPANDYQSLWAAMAQGIVEGLGWRPFFTYHPQGGTSSSAWLHEAEWLDMNMWQSGHALLDAPNWEMIRSDYDRNLTKPVL